MPSRLLLALPRRTMRNISTAEVERHPCAHALAVYVAVTLTGRVQLHRLPPSLTVTELFAVVEFFAHWSAPRL